MAFQWASCWDAVDCGRLLALADESHWKEEDYNPHSGETTLAGGSFNTPYTKHKYVPRYSLLLSAIMPLRRSATAFHRGLVSGN